MQDRSGRLQSGALIRQPQAGSDVWVGGLAVSRTVGLKGELGIAAGLARAGTGWPGTAVQGQARPDPLQLKGCVQTAVLTGKASRRRPGPVGSLDYKNRQVWQLACASFILSSFVPGSDQIFRRNLEMLRQPARPNNASLVALLVLMQVAA